MGGPIKRWSLRSYGLFPRVSVVATHTVNDIRAVGTSEHFRGVSELSSSGILQPRDEGIRAAFRRQEKTGERGKKRSQTRQEEKRRAVPSRS